MAKKKTPVKLVKPATRSKYKQFESDAAEVNALVRTLESHLEKLNDDQLPRNERKALSSEIGKFTEDLTNKRTTPGKILPRLRDIAKHTTLPGAIKTSKGTWLYSEAIREGKEQTEPVPRSASLSPDLLASQNMSEASDPETSDPSIEESKDSQESMETEKTGTTTIEKAEAETPEYLQLELNPYYKLQLGESGTNSSDSSQETANTPPQETGSQVDEEEEDTLETIAARVRKSNSKTESDIFAERIKSGLKDLDTRKKQLEKSLGDKIHEAKDKIIEQATEQHEKFTDMSSNNMAQYSENVQNLLSNKVQELHDTTAKWKENYERAIKHIHDTQGKQFEKKCQDTQLQENKKMEKAHISRESKIQMKMNEIESDMLNQAQSLLDQLPIDMTDVKLELETELRDYGDQVRKGMEEAQTEQHLQQLASSLMAEMQTQVAGYKSDMNSMVGSSRDYNTLPTQAQHNERMRLRNEIVTEIRNDLGMNTANAQWIRTRQEISTEIHNKIQMEIESKTRTDTNEAYEDMGGRLALAEVAIDKLTDQLNQNSQEQKQLNTKTSDEREIENDIQRRLTKLDEMQSLQISQAKTMQTRIEVLEALNREQEQTIAHLQQARTRDEATHDQEQTARMATPEYSHRDRRPYQPQNDERTMPNIPTSDNDGSNQRYTTPQRHTRGHEDEERTPPTIPPQQQNRRANEHGNRWNVDPATINPRWDRHDSQHDHQSYPREQQDSHKNESQGNQRNVNPDTLHLRWERERRSNEKNNTNRNPDDRYDTSNQRSNRHQHQDSFDSDGYGSDGYGSTNTIPKEEKAAMETAIRGFEKKYTNISELTDTPTQQTIETLYRQLAYQANNSSIPMRPLKNVERGQPIYPDTAKHTIHPKVLERFSATLHHKIEMLIPDTVPIYHDIVAQNTSNEDGYTTLYQILSTVIPKLQDFRPKWGPLLPTDQDMFRFVRMMQQHTLSEADFGRPYTELEIITNIIQHALDDARYEMTARTAKASIQSALAQGTMITLTMQNIAQTLEPSRSIQHALNTDVPTMHKFETKRSQSLDPKKQVQCRSCQAWGHDGQCFMMCKIVNINKWIKDNQEEAEKQASLFSQTNSKRMVNLLQVEDEESLYAGIENMYTALTEPDAPQEGQQAPAIHKMQAPTNWENVATEYLTSAPGTLQPFQMATAYIDASRTQPPTQQQTREEATSVVMKTMKINLQQDDVRQIRFTHQADGGANFAATDRLDLLHTYKVYNKPIAIMAFFPQDEDSTTTPQEHTAIGEGILKLIGDHGEIIPMRMLYTPNSTGTVISPERTMKDLQRYNPKNNRIVSWSQNGGQQRSVQWKDTEGRTVSSLQMEERNGLYYIKNATLLPPPKPTVKAIQTIEPIQEEEQNDQEERDNSNSTQEQEDNAHNATTTIEAAPAVSIPKLPAIHATSVPATDTAATNDKTRRPDPPAANSPSPSHDPHRHTDIDDPATTENPATHTTSADTGIPIPSNTSSARSTSWTSNLTKGIRQLEIWHQRMGHPSPTVLQRTQKVVEGIPTLPNAAPIFHCRFCDQAKQHKAARGKREINDAYLPGSMFHMDLGFFRGPSNLDEVVHNGANPSNKTIIKSIEGNVAYLCIIDAATRMLWTFPLKTKHPPIAIIDKFLSRYGTKGANRRITTNPNGFLAQSQMFRHLCQRNGFDYAAQANKDLEPSLESIMASLPKQQRIIRTDGGKEFAGSDAFREKCNEHDYDVQVTGPDSSSQNGKGERPHRTLAEKTKCLLYTARLGMPFWCSALVHATYLYNRTYHSAIDQTPYEAFTGLKPLCGHILTYGCTITAKKPTGRPTKADPNTYEGIFLGYGATSKNIKYHDVHSQRRKWAHHNTIDEFQYGDDPADRSIASKHILETFTKLPHNQIGGKKMHQPKKTLLIQPIPVAHFPNELDIQMEPLPYTAAAAKFAASKFERPMEDDLIKNLEQCSISLDDAGPIITEKVILKGTHPLLGMTLLPDKDNPTRIYLQNCNHNTPMSTILRWRSRLRGAHVRSINDIPVHSAADIKSIIAEQRQLRRPTVLIQFAKPIAPSMADHGVPQLHLDQLNVIAHHLDAIKQQRTKSWPGLPTDMPPLDDEDIEAAIYKGLAIPRMTRRTVMKSPEAAQWLRTEWTQLSKYMNQGMFGDPCLRPNDPNAVILPFVWTYVHKIDPITNAIVEKARGTCNGGKRHGKAVTIAETYAACVEQPAQRLYWALVAALNMTAIGCDVGNAFAEAPPPTQPFYMYIDDQFREWWENCLGRPPIPRGYVLKVNKALQGHPEAPRLWHKHIDRIMTKELQFQATTHETCLYHKMIDGDLVLVLRQVDDFSIASRNPEHCKRTIQEIESRMQNPLNDLGVIKRFNGIDILQARDFVKISCETYIDKIVSHHGWQDEVASNQPVPMRSDSASLRKLELSKGPEDPSTAQALEQEMGFSYRQAIGELIFAMTVGRIDISYPIIKLSQYSAQPSKEHYQAVKQIFVYLNATRTHGLTYWRPESNNNHLYSEPPIPISTPSNLHGFPETHAAETLHGYVDSDWGSDRQHRRSISGIVFMLAGAAIFYKTRYQPTVALSSTEAEFAAAADAGKAALYLRSILQELGVDQLLPTVIYEDNNGARLMTNAQQPTRRTRHVELKQFAVLQWVEDEQIIFGDIATTYNISDSLTKQTGRTKFHQHHDILMGRLRPTYARHSNPDQPIISKCSIYACDYIDIYDYSNLDLDTVTSMGR